MLVSSKSMQAMTMKQAADEQNPDKEFDVPQLPIGQIVPGETNTTSFSIR